MSTDASGGVWTAHLDAPVVRAAVARARSVRGTRPVGVVGSTQDVALDLAAQGVPSGTLVIADLQTAGRGRRGRAWNDHPAGRTLATTLLLDVDEVPVPALMPHALGLAVVLACAAAVPAAPPLTLKWPNDVVRRPVGGRARKLSGVLVERDRISTSEGAREVLRCGIGIDVDLRGVDEAPDRVCLAAVAGERPDPAALLAALVECLDGVIVALHDPASFIARYRRASDTIGRRVRVEPPGEAAFVGLATTVDDAGQLVVMTDVGPRVILSGTVRDATGTEEAT